VSSDLEILVNGVRRLVPRAVDNFIPSEYAVEHKLGRCLPATRIGMEALRYFGVNAKPLPMKVVAGNYAWMEWILENPGATYHDMPDEAWAVGVGHRENHGPGVDVHVVLNVEDEIMLDLDARQLSRPAKGMPVPDTILAPFQGGFEAQWHNDVVVVNYVPHENPPQWKHGSDWRKAGKQAGPVIRALKAELPNNNFLT
jgi:hypothetical protein